MLITTDLMSADDARGSGFVAAITPAVGFKSPEGAV